MKLKYEFTVRQVAGEHVLIPMGKSALAFSGMITTNAVGAAICQRLSAPAEPEELVECLCREFEAEEEIIRQDLEEFLTVLRAYDLLEE